MFFFISKILSFLLNPLIWVFFMLIIAYTRKNKVLGRKLLLITILVFYFFSNKFICDEFVRKWEADYPRKDVMAKSFDVAIVLGGKIVEYDYQNNKLIFREQADRFLQALALYQQQKIKKILVCGGPGSLYFRDQYEAAFLKKYLLSIHIPETDILVDSVSDNTRENALNTKKILDSLKYDKNSCLLITSALHIPRSTAIFKKCGINTTAYPVSKITGERLFNFNHLLLPHIESFDCWYDLMHEWTGFLVYKIMGYA